MLRALAAALTVFGMLAAPAAAKLRPIPDTSGQIRVWNDQYSLPLTDAQARFPRPQQRGHPRRSRPARPISAA